MWTLTIQDNSRSDQFCIHTSDKEVYARLVTQIKYSNRFALISAEYVKG